MPRLVVLSPVVEYRSFESQCIRIFKLILSTQNDLTLKPLLSTFDRQSPVFKVTKLFHLYQQGHFEIVERVHNTSMLVSQVKQYL